MQKLISYGKDAYDYYDILKKDMELPAVPVKNGIRDTAELEIAYPDTDSLRVLMRENEEVKIVKKTAKELTAPVYAGQEAGQVEYYVGGTRIAGYQVRVKKAVGEWNLKFCAETLLKLFFI